MIHAGTALFLSGMTDLGLDRIYQYLQSYTNQFFKEQIMLTIRDSAVICFFIVTIFCKRIGKSGQFWLYEHILRRIPKSLRGHRLARVIPHVLVEHTEPVDTLFDKVDQVPTNSGTPF